MAQSAYAALLAGCSTLDALNPFASSGPKMAELQPIQASAKCVCSGNTVGKAEELTFVPAVVDASVYAAARDGTVARFDDGQQVWRIKAGTAALGWRRRR
ncbi:MAG: hypothetical protein V5B38_02365 [Candidatus Accumulibacter propinquus]